VKGIVARTFHLLISVIFTSRGLDLFGQFPSTTNGTRSDTLSVMMDKNSARAFPHCTKSKTFIFAKNMAHMGMKCGVKALLFRFYQITPMV
jgi:hypothetical protein